MMQPPKCRIDLHALRFQRSMNQSNLPKAEKRDGVWICRWCGGVCPGGRTGWCSEECVDEYLIRSDASLARRRVEQRDGEICAACGVDAGMLYRERQHYRWHYNRGYPGRHSRQEWNVDRGLKPHHEATLWEADHITPVIEGGGCCGLDNLRTLCIWCHHEDTAELAARRAAKARAPQDVQLELT